jgi:hypothetical protein
MTKTTDPHRYVLMKPELLTKLLDEQQYQGYH